MTTEIVTSQFAELATLDDFCDALRELRGDLRALMYRLGELQHAASQRLTRLQFNTFRVRAKEGGFSYKTLELAANVFYGKHPELPRPKKVNPIDERLVGAVSPTKLLNMGAETQKRCLSDQHFEVKQPDQSVAAKTFADMSLRERNRILDNNGNVLPPEKQHAPMKRPPLTGAIIQAIETIAEYVSSDPNAPINQVTIVREWLTGEEVAADAN